MVIIIRIVKDQTKYSTQTLEIIPVLKNHNFKIHLYKISAKLTAKDNYKLRLIEIVETQEHN